METITILEMETITFFLLVHYLKNTLFKDYSIRILELNYGNGKRNNFLIFITSSLFYLLNIQNKSYYPIIIYFRYRADTSYYLKLKYYQNVSCMLF